MTEAYATLPDGSRPRTLIRHAAAAWPQLLAKSPSPGALHLRYKTSVDLSKPRRQQAASRQRSHHARPAYDGCLSACLRPSGWPTESVSCSSWSSGRTGATRYEFRPMLLSHSSDSSTVPRLWYLCAGIFGGGALSTPAMLVRPKPLYGAGHTCALLLLKLVAVWCGFLMGCPSP